jgi:signal transduction histidine kinase
MRLAAKFLFFLMICVIAVLAVYEYLYIRSETDQIRDEMAQDAVLIGSTLKGLFTDTWERSGPEQALELIEEANRSEHLVHIRWIRPGASKSDPDGPCVARDRLAPVLEGKMVSMEGTDREGVRSFITYVPVETGALELTEPLSQQYQQVRRYLKKMVPLTVIIVLSSAVLMTFLGYWLVGRPIHLLIEKARRMGEGDLKAPLVLKGRDEIAELAGEINDMCGRLLAAQEKIEAETTARISALEQLRHADRLKTVGRLASGIAHELGTPLNVVSGRAGIIANGRLSGEEVVKGAEIIKAQAERMAGIIRQFLDFARRRAPKMKNQTDLRQIVGQCADLLDTMGRKAGCSLEFKGLEEAATARVDAGQIQQVLVNLIVNAFQAMPGGGRVEVGLRREKGMLCLHVLDEGEGIPEKNRDHIFDPFFTTKDVGDGTGLGLSIAYGIIEEHGGRIEVESALGKGSRFSIYLPQEEDANGRPDPDRG